jgi:Rps23 Pro-64 3,4-dihydroxylase Tpa1-like proline 4-hydroxylase
MFDYIIKEHPFPHIIINNFYTDEELKYVWEELEFLTVNKKLKDVYETESALDYSGEILKNNKARFLAHEYDNYKTKSPIAYYTNKIYDLKLIDDIISKHWFFNYLRACNHDSCLVSYYENGDYYKTHFDTSVLTCLVHLYKEPKSFTGGDLYLPDFNYKIEDVNNRLIMFPSSILHKVESISMDQSNENSCNGRYTITQFMGISL